MKKYFFFLFLFSFAFAFEDAHAKLAAPYDLELPKISERSAQVEWKWISGGGAITDFELLLGRKESVSECPDIKEWEFTFRPGKHERQNTVRGLSRLEQGQVYCWKIMARAVNPINNSEFAYGDEFRNEVTNKAGFCGDGDCGAGEDPISCSPDCKNIGNGSGIPAILENPISSQTLPELLENVLNFLFGLAIVVLPIIILYGGILMLTAGGEPEKISKSRTILLWAVVAFVIILLARGLPTVLRGIL